jgi:ubiquitin thioesterase protein OTUB1
MDPNQQADGESQQQVQQ